MDAVVLKAFMTSPDAIPARKRVAPSDDPSKPVIVQIPAWAFTRHFGLGNCMTVDAYQARRELDLEMDRARAGLRKQEEELGKRALAESKRLAIEEEIAALVDLDSDQLVSIARQHGFHVTARGAVKTVRDNVRRGLEKQLAALAPSEPEIVEVDPMDGASSVELRVSLDDLKVSDALPLIEACDSGESIALWALAERDGGNRSTVLAALGRRYVELGGDIGDLDG